MIRILIVDDHEMVREGLRAMLRHEPDFDVVGDAATAEGIVELVEETRPDVLLLDARLPGVGGPEASRLLCRSHPELAVLIISTYSDDELVEQCIRAGARGYVVKDIEQFTLKESIRAVYRGEGAVSPVVATKLLHRLRDSAAGPEIPLNDSQREILRLIAQGFSNREIGAKVYLSENTVKSHVQEIFRKLNVRTRVEAALRAAEKGWLVES